MVRALVDQHTELAEVRAIPGRSLGTHGGEDTGPEIASDVSATAVPLAPPVRCSTTAAVPSASRDKCDRVIVSEFGRRWRMADAAHRVLA